MSLATNITAIHLITVTKNIVKKGNTSTGVKHGHHYPNGIIPFTTSWIKRRAPGRPALLNGPCTVNRLFN